MLAAIGCGRAPEVEARGAAAPAARPAASTERSGSFEPVRDVVLVTIDTLRADAPGFAGGGASTPRLDRLAAGGWTFTGAHAHAVTTLPSHASMLTGRLPFEHGVRTNGGYTLREELPTAATVLAGAGFATGAFVAAFPLDSRFGLDRGFDVYDDRTARGQGAEFALPERRGDEVVAAARAWWQANAARRRFLWVHLFDPHAPYAPPEPFASAHPGQPYLGEVAAVDSFLAPLLEPHLAGAEPPALVVVTSDHGEGLGEHGELTHGLFAYESTLAVPLLLWRRGLGAARLDEPASHVDLLPTLLAAAGVDGGPAELPGRSLLEAPEDAGEIVTHFEALDAYLERGWAPLQGVIQGGSKLIALPIPELYDLEADPRELDNRYGRERRAAAALAARLPADALPSERPPLPAEEVAALRSLGYSAGGEGPGNAFGPEDDPKRLVEIDRLMHRFIDLYQRRELVEATEVGRELVRRQPRMGAAHYHLAQALLERGERAEALAVLERAAARGVRHRPLQRQLALLLAEAGRSAEAVRLLEGLASPRDVDTLDALGLVLAESGQPARAREVLLRAAAADAGDPVSRQHLALVALHARQWDEARRRAEEALELAGGSLPQAWNYLGVARRRLGDVSGALAAWERASQLAPRDFDLLYNIAFTAAEAGEVERARAAARAFVAGAPPERYAADLPKTRELLRRLEQGTAGSSR